MADTTSLPPGAIVIDEATFEVMKARATRGEQAIEAMARAKPALAAMEGLASRLDVLLESIRRAFREATDV